MAEKRYSIKCRRFQRDVRTGNKRWIGPWVEVRRYSNLEAACRFVDEQDHGQFEWKLLDEEDLYEVDWVFHLANLRGAV